MNKNIRIVLIVLLTIILAGGVYYAVQGNPFATSTPTPPKITGNSPGAESSPVICYLDRITTPSGNDDTALSIVFNKNMTVTGEFNLLPSEKDTMTGTITGAWSPLSSSTRMVGAKHAYKAEGTDGVQDIFFKISPQIAEVSWDKGRSYPQSLTRVSCNELK